MRNLNFYKYGFLVAGLFDLILGVVFFLFYRVIYELFSITLPDNIAYIHITAAFVIVQGLMYYLVSQNLEKNLDMVKAGIAYKSVYILLVLYYWSINMLPHPMFALFGIFDVGFLALFILYMKDFESLTFSGPAA